MELNSILTLILQTGCISDAKLDESASNYLKRP